MLRFDLMAGCALACVLAVTPAAAQDLQTRPVAPPPPLVGTAQPSPQADAASPQPAAPPAQADTTPPVASDQVQFSANALEYDQNADVVTATGDVRMYRTGDRLRADKVVWDRKSGKVVATGNIAITNPQGDVAYGDSIDLTDSLKDGVVDNMLIVLERGGRIAARTGTRHDDGTVELQSAAYTPCSVTNAKGCPKEPSWKITAVRVTYRPSRERLYFTGARMNLFGLPTVPLPTFSAPIGQRNDSGILNPDIRLEAVNGLQVAVPYYKSFGPNRGLTITPHVYSAVLPMLQLDYHSLGELGAYQIGGYVTVSRRSDDITTTGVSPDSHQAVRGYVDGLARFQLSPEWSIAASLRYVSDLTFLRRYQISSDDRLRNMLSLQHIDANSYFSITGWAVETLRVNDVQGLQPVALPEIDYRRRIDESLTGGHFMLQLNTLALTRTAGQDTQRAFASVEWDLRKLTPWGQEVTFTAFARGDLYHTSNVAATDVLAYQGLPGMHARAIGAVAVDVKWPFVGSFLGGTQRFTPRLQIVAAPNVDNSAVPNEDSRAIDLDDSNLFALNRFPGYDRFEDSSRATYGAEWALDLPGLTFDSVIGQSYRLTDRPSIFYPGTGLSDRLSDIVGRSELRYRDFVSIVARYRIDKDDFAIRRNEIDATIGSRSTYVLLGYLRLNRNIDPIYEDLYDHDEVRAAGRVQFSRFWSAFGSTVIDLTTKAQDPTSIANGFQPIRHRLGVQYEDDCLRLGFTWRRDYVTTGDARAGNGFLLTLAFTNLGR